MLQGARLLIVDDNYALRTLLRDYMTSLGTVVFEASDGQEALKWADTYAFDVIMTDVRMPNMDGVEFIRQVPEKNRHAVKIMMSGNASLDEAVRGFKQDIDDFIIKPFVHVEMVKKTIEHHLEKKALQRELSFKEAFFKVHSEILNYLTTHNDPKQFFHFIFDTVKNTLPLDRMDLYLLDAQQKKIYLKYIEKLSDRSVDSPGIPIDLSESGFLDLFYLKKTRIISDLSSELSFHRFWFFQHILRDGIKSGVLFPLLVENEIYGFLGLYSKKNGQYSQKTAEVFESILPNIAFSFEKSFGQGSLSTENSFLKNKLDNLHFQLNRQQESLIFSLAELSEQRDQETGHHLLRMQLFAKMMAEVYFASNKILDIGYGSMSNDVLIDLIHKTAPLHDIGKVGISDAILQKPGKLTLAEWEIMKTHTTLGAVCLESALKRTPASPYLLIGKDIAEFHHERYDGFGYPLGLSGHKIPLPARIIAIADNYDALRSKRVYKNAWSHEEVLNYMKDQRGKYFDPDLVDVFFEIEKEFKDTYKKYEFTDLGSDEVSISLKSG